MLGLGTDLVEISRVGVLLQRHGSRFRDRVFRAAEPGGAWSGDVDDEAAGRAPVLRLSGAAARALEAMGGRSTHLSLARAGDWAAALVTIA